MGYTIFGKVDTLEEFEKLKSKKEPEFTIKEEPFSWNDNFSEVALEDFSMVQKSYHMVFVKVLVWHWLSWSY